MTDMRNYIVDTIKPLLPRKWRYVATTGTLDKLDAVTVQLILQSVSKVPEAPFAKHLQQITYELNVFDPSTNPDSREQSLDDELIELLAAIEAVENLTWTTADRILDASGQAQQYLGYSINIQTINSVDDAEGA